MTIKQKMAVKEIIENHRSVSAAMRAVGYKASTATVPKNLTQSKAWPELLNEYLPDKKLLTATDEALKATKWNDFTGEREADHNARLKAADQGYKLKGRLSEGTQVNQQFNVGEGGGVTYIIRTTNDIQEFDNLTSEPVKDIPVEEAK